MRQAVIIFGFLVFSFGADLSVSAQAIDSLEFFHIVDINPTFQGSNNLNLFAEYISSELIYPEEAIRDSFEGRINVMYTIDSTGKLINPLLLDSVPSYIEKEIERVLTSSPQWTPGQIEGRNVNVLFAIPITFSLSNSKTFIESNNQPIKKRKKRKKRKKNYR